MADTIRRGDATDSYEFTQGGQTSFNAIPAFVPALLSTPTWVEPLQAATRSAESPSFVHCLIFGSALASVLFVQSASAFVAKTDKFIRAWQSPLKERLQNVRNQHTFSEKTNTAIWGLAMLGAGLAIGGHEALSLATLTVSTILSRKTCSRAIAMLKAVVKERDDFMAEDRRQINLIRRGPGRNSSGLTRIN